MRLRGPRRPRPGSCSVSGLPARSSRELGVAAAVDGVLPAWKDVSSEPLAGVSWLRVGRGGPGPLQLPGQTGRPSVCPRPWSSCARLTCVGPSLPCLASPACQSLPGSLPPGPVHHHQRQETAAFPFESSVPSSVTSHAVGRRPAEPMESAGAAHAAGRARPDPAVPGQVHPAWPRERPCWTPGRPGFKDIFFYDVFTS